MDSSDISQLRRLDPEGYRTCLSIFERNGLRPENLLCGVEQLEELHVYREEIRSQGDQLEEAHRQLQEALTRYRALFDLAPSGYLEVDEAGRILELNLKASEMLRLSRSVLNSRDVYLYRSFSLSDRHG